MTDYRFFTIGIDGHILGAEVVECADDEEALRKAKLAISGPSVEVWEHGRFLARLPGKQVLQAPPTQRRA